MRAIIIVIMAAAMLAILLVVSIKEYLSIPVAIFSHSTGQCVRLIQDGDIKTPCGRLPERYHMEWMQ